MPQTHRAYAQDMLLNSDHAPGGVIVYHADGDEEIIHVNQYMIDLFECDSLEEFLEFTGGSFKGIVHAHDLDAAEDSITAQVKEHDNFDHIYYRIETKTGRLISIEDYGRLVEDPVFGPVFHVFIYEIEQGGSVDWLTGLPDTKRFHKLARLGAGVIAARGEHPAVVALDLIGLKAYNAHYGWDEGDKMLCRFADVVRKHFGSEACSRFAEDHFYAYAPAEGLDEKIRALFADFVETDGLKVLPIRAGVYVCDPEDDIAKVGLDRAKLACDADCKTWRSHVTWFSAEMRDLAQLRIHVLEYVDQAINRGWIRPYYQAIVRAATGNVCGEEALARWEDPVLGMLAPAQFVPVLEEAGLQYKVDMHVIDCVLRDMVKKRELGIPVVPVSVNLSQRDLEQLDIVEEISSRAAKYDIAHDYLRIEFTESAASGDHLFFQQQVDQLRQAGFAVWMDDFGSGYSSLNTLKDFDFDVIKLDMGFVSGIGAVKARWIIEGVVRSAERMGVNTLAEGVENEEQALILEEIGCAMLQGFHYVRPKPLEEIIAECQNDNTIHRETIKEQAFWNAVSMLNLKDMELSEEEPTNGDSPLSDAPFGVVEKWRGKWVILRANRAYRAFLADAGLLPLERSPLEAHPVEGPVDPEFEFAAERSLRSRKWERVNGRLEDRAGFQFYLKPVASSPEAEAFMVASVPTMLGSALGEYGDVPVGYSVFRGVLDEAREAVVDTEYIYANNLYCSWIGYDLPDLIGRSFLEVNGAENEAWFPYCYRAIVLGETVNDTIYSPEAGHWLNFTIAPSLVDGCCVYAFSIVDEQRRQRDEIEWAGTHDPLTKLLDRRGIDKAIGAFLENNPDVPFAIALIDADNFKMMNDVHGHDVGDKALHVLVERLENMFPPTAIMGRNGGDEFLVMLSGDDMDRADELFNAFADEPFDFELDGMRYRLTTSVGYACFPEQADSLRSMYTMADQALYSMKLAGKHGCLKYDDVMKAQYPLQLGLTPRDITENVPGAVMVHRADGAGEILYANDELLAMLECENPTDFMSFTGGTFGGIMHPEDSVRVSEEIADQAELDESGRKVVKYYRIVTKSGAVKHVTGNGRLVELEGLGKVFYTLIIDRDE